MDESMEDDPTLNLEEVTAGLAAEEEDSKPQAEEEPPPAAAASETATEDAPVELEAPLKRKYPGGLTPEGKCRRCESGPSYKKGHHVSCPKSAYYEGSDPEAALAASRRRSRPFPRKKPRSSATAEAYSSLDAAKKQLDSIDSQIQQAEQELQAAVGKRDEALGLKAAAQEALEQAKEMVVQAELREDDEWNTMYYKLKQHAQENSILFPRGCQDARPDNADFQALCQWVKTQRNKRDKIKWQRKAALDALGFVWDPFEAAWQDQYAELVKHHEEFGHCNVPSGYKPAPNLAQWVATQRKNYRLMQEGRKVQLTEDRIKLLENIGFEFNRATKSKWQNQFDDLVAYKLVHGDMNVPKDYESSPGLKAWMTLQRTHYRFFQEGKPSVLTQDRVKKLNEIGFPWSESDKWSMHFHDLTAHHRLHGNCNVDESSSNVVLVNFCQQQRDEYSKLQKGQPSSLSPERLALLTNLGFQWTVPASTTETAAQVSATSEQSQEKV